MILSAIFVWHVWLLRPEVPLPVEIVKIEQATALLLLCGASITPAPVRDALTASGFSVVDADLASSISGYASPVLTSPDVVLVNVTGWSEEPSETIRSVKSKLLAIASGVRLLCFSTTRKSPRFVLKLMERSARYTRIADAATLIEAVELILAEDALESKRIPTFRVEHGFSQGTCAPGEEVTMVQFVWLAMKFQLRLALAERLVFNLFGQYRTIAIDAAQVVSGLGGWFYRDHARNSGNRQIVKVRVPTVKVIVQRIRRAMAVAFDKAGAPFNPYDVLQSFHAEGTNRVLYKLNAAVQIEHTLRRE